MKRTPGAGAAPKNRIWDDLTSLGSWDKDNRRSSIVASRDFAFQP